MDPAAKNKNNNIKKATRIVLFSAKATANKANNGIKAAKRLVEQVKEEG